MDVKVAIDNLLPGREAAQLAACVDTLLKAEYPGTEILPKILPFLGKNLIERNIVDYSAEPGVDIANSYFVLWEPFIRAKMALLIGTVIEKCKEVPDVAEIIPPLVDMFLCEEEIEQCFALIAITNIGLRKPEAILPLLPKLIKPLIAIVGQAAMPAKPFCLYHSEPFQRQVFESFLDFMYIPGLFGNPENVQRLVENNITLAIIQIALSAHVYLTQKVDILWRMTWIFLRLTTEHPQGVKMWDIDHIPKTGFESCILMRAALKGPDRAATIRNMVDKIPQKERSLERYKLLVKEIPK
jgi:hypothetical protein